jgi:hypothetical protein
MYHEPRALSRRRVSEHALQRRLHPSLNSFHRPDALDAIDSTAIVREGAYQINETSHSLCGYAHVVHAIETLRIADFGSKGLHVFGSRRRFAQGVQLEFASLTAPSGDARALYCCALQRCPSQVA